MIGRSTPHRVQTGSRPPHPPIKWVPEALSLGVKRPGREVDHSPPMPRLRMCGATTPPYAFMAWCSVKAQGLRYLQLFYEEELDEWRLSSTNLGIRWRWVVSLTPPSARNNTLWSYSMLGVFSDFGTVRYQHITTQFNLNNLSSWC
jgi:hypothetical protein